MRKPPSHTSPHPIIPGAGRYRPPDISKSTRPRTFLNQRNSESAKVRECESELRSGPGIGAARIHGGSPGGTSCFCCWRILFAWRDLGSARGIGSSRGVTGFGLSVGLTSFFGPRERCLVGAAGVVHELVRAPGRLGLAEAGE